MLITDFTGMAGIAFGCTILLLRWPVLAALTSVRRTVLGAAVLALLLLPFGGLSIAELMRGMTGDLSITSLLLLAMAMRKPSMPIKSEILLLIVLSGGALYVLSLGFGEYDLYRPGFGNLFLLAGLLIVAIVAWWRNELMLSLPLAVLAWSVGYYESTNLWDYLLDPVLLMYALGAMIYRLILRYKQAVRKHRKINVA